MIFHNLLYFNSQILDIKYICLYFSIDFFINLLIIYSNYLYKVVNIKSL